MEAKHNQDPRESNRQKYPEIAEFIDRLREVFGGGVKVEKLIDKPTDERTNLHHQD